jgi:hypothetical protein
MTTKAKKRPEKIFKLIMVGEKLPGVSIFLILYNA